MPRTRKNKKGGIFGFFKRKKDATVPQVTRKTQQLDESNINDRQFFKDNFKHYVKQKCIPASLTTYVEETRNKCKGFFSRNFYPECRRIKKLPPDVGICEETVEQSIPDGLPVDNDKPKSEEPMEQSIPEDLKVDEKQKSEEPMEQSIPEDLTVDEIIRIMDFEKEIDGIKFCAISMVLAYDIEHVDKVNNVKLLHNTDKVQVVSTDINGKRRFFWAYQSNSEMGLWRWCTGKEKTYTNNGKTVYKYTYDKITGIPFYKKRYGDYVQTTLLHIQLQSYLNEIINSPEHREKIIAITRSITKNRTSPLEGLFRFKNFTSCKDFFANKKSDKDWQEIQLVSPLTREIQTSPFDMFTDNEQCGNPIHQRVVQQFSKQFKKDYEVVDTNLIYENYKFEKTYHNPQIGEVSKIKMVGDLKEFILTRRPQAPSEDPRVNRIKLIYLETKEIILNVENKTDTLTNEMKQPSWMFSDPPLTNTGMPFPKRKYHMPIALIPIIADVPECNAYGLYSNYIKAGAYICKLFDYVEQCREDERKRTICMSRYVFIGDRYNKLFPFTYEPPQSLFRGRTLFTSPKTQLPLITEQIPDTTVGGLLNKSRRRRGRKSRMSLKRR
jgi:hypothetical protein